jgi:hypothetical protein
MADFEYTHEFLLNVKKGDPDPGAPAYVPPPPAPIEPIPEGATIFFENDHYALAAVAPFGKRWYRKVEGATRGQATRAEREYKKQQREAQQARLDERAAAREARRAARSARPGR